MWYIMMDIIYIYIYHTTNIFSTYLYIYIISISMEPGHCWCKASAAICMASWALLMALEPWYLATRQATAWRGENAARRRGPWGFSMGKMVVLVGFPPLKNAVFFFFGRKIMGRVERSMTNHIFMQHSWYNQQYGSLIRFNRDNIEIIANNIHGFRQSPNQKGGFN